MDASPIVPSKRCTKCGNQYPATPEHFQPRKDRNNQLKSWCRACERLRQREYYINHPESARERKRRYRATHSKQLHEYEARRYAANPEKARQRVKDYREAHIDERREYDRQYRIKHPDKVREKEQRRRAKDPEKARERVRQWQRNNREKLVIYSRTRKARKRAAEGTHTTADIEAQFQRQKGKCYYCGCKMTKQTHQLNSATVDHVIPITRGGRNSPDNLVIACLNCNSSKHDRLPHEWLQGGRLI